MTRLALLHPSSLLGSEVRETLGRRRELWQEVRLLTDDEEEAGTLTDVAGAAAMVTALEAGDLDRVDVAFFCGGIEKSRPLIAALPASATPIILSPDAAPGDGEAVVAGVNLESARAGAPLVSPHPGAVLLAHLLHPLRDLRPARASATLLQPASALTRAALDEVFEQTRGILRFDPKASRQVFGTQVAFNAIPSPTSAEQLVPHLRAVLDPPPEELAVQVLQTGVFHSFGASLHVVLAEDPGPEEVRRALAKHPFNDLAVDPELLGMIDAAARDEVLVGPVEPDPGCGGAYWIWAVMDNLTCGGAGNAVRILEAILQPFVH